MRLLNGQVHVAELLAVAVFSVPCFLVDTSLPLVAGLAMALWPLFLMQMVLDGFGIWLGGLIFKHHNTGQPRAPKRTGVARFLWLIPLSAMTIGYGIYVVQTGRWLL